MHENIIVGINSDYKKEEKVVTKLPLIMEHGKRLG